MLAGGARTDWSWSLIGRITAPILKKVSSELLTIAHPRPVSLRETKGSSRLTRRVCSAAVAVLTLTIVRAINAPMPNRVVLFCMIASIHHGDVMEAL